MAATLGLRTMALPLVIMQMKNTVKLAQAKPEMERLAARAKLTARPPSFSPLLPSRSDAHCRVSDLHSCRCRPPASLKEPL